MVEENSSGLTRRTRSLVAELRATLESDEVKALERNVASTVRHQKVLCRQESGGADEAESRFTLLAHRSVGGLPRVVRYSGTIRGPYGSPSKRWSISAHLGGAESACFGEDFGEPVGEPVEAAARWAVWQRPAEHLQHMLSRQATRKLPREKVAPSLHTEARPKQIFSCRLDQGS
jgi:hypothetical protein